ncbi:MAG TPA: serine/threonine-protein kinase [Polyangiaceae bacterium]
MRGATLQLLPWLHRRLHPGDRLGGYRIVRSIASGAYGDVYEALELKLERTVAIKVLQPRHLRSDKHREQFLTEARILAGIKNEHVVSILRVSDDVPMVWMVMEYLDGGTLRDLLSTEEPVPLTDALRYAACAAKGIGAAHAAGVIHRDLKPENIFLTDLGRVAVGDFGTAKELRRGRKQTLKIVGTPAYLSPEAAAAQDVDHRSDVYSLGLVLYELLTGRQAFPLHPGMNVQDLLYQQIHGFPPRIRELAPWVPEHVERIVWKLLQKKPAARYQSALEVEAECLDALEDLKRNASPENTRHAIGRDARARGLLPDTVPQSPAAGVPGREPSPESALRSAIWAVRVAVAALAVSVVLLALAMRARLGDAPEVPDPKVENETSPSRHCDDPSSGCPPR